ncbi:MAG TPA: nucleoside 2-deoxyribosyltransferase [Nitrososphaerales archaeon]|nr:nucleoside 2-deoxyribosyltransferase [Nitrososphaerales archaeon]
MKVYLSVPMVANRAIERANEMARAIRETGNELISPWVLGELESVSKTGIDIFSRDMVGSETCDVLVADVTSPSVGVGMEIMAAHKAGKKVLILSKKGEPVSGMLRKMEAKVEVEYENDNEVFSLVRDALASL